MIDTLRISLKDYKSRNPDVIIQPSSFNPSHGEQDEEFRIIKNDKKWIYGKKGYINTENWNLNINPLAEKFRDKDRDCSTTISLSIPRFFMGRNRIPINKEETKIVFKTLESQLKDRGIHTNIMNSEVNRIDTFVNVSTKHEFLDYIPVFKLLKFPFLKSHTDYGDTFLVQNGNRQLSIYDKIEEETFKDNDKKKSDDIKHDIIRVEYRVIKKPAVRELYKVNSLNDLIDNYEFIESKYYDYVEKIFPQELDSKLYDRSIGTIEDYSSAIEHFKELNVQRPVETLMYSIGFNKILNDIGVEAFLNIVKQTMTNKSYLNLRKKLLSQKLNYNLKNEQLSDLYYEFRDKLLYGASNI